jgi:hypothetical protein
MGYRGAIDDMERELTQLCLGICKGKEKKKKKGNDKTDKLF